MTPVQLEAVTEPGRTPFEQSVHDVLVSLTVGDVVTYGEVALEAGYSKRFARAVGGVLSRSGGGYPWWRVINATGRLAPGKEQDQARRLRAEGVQVSGDRVVSVLNTSG